MTSTAKPLICIIDDEEDVRAVLRTQLEAAGFATSEAGDGLQGVREVRRAATALAIVDIVMPDQEGLATIRELKAKFPTVKILAMTGSGRQYLAIAREFGADDAMDKPFRGHEVVQRVKTLLGMPGA